MNRYEGTQTEKNLRAAFAGESQARNKYTYFSAVAQKEGLDKIAEIFKKTANNEEQHAKMWLTELGEINSTKENLTAAADGENYEWTDMYVGFAKTAEEEGTETPAVEGEQGELDFDGDEEEEDDPEEIKKLEEELAKSL